MCIDVKCIFFLVLRFFFYLLTYTVFNSKSKMFSVYAHFCCQSYFELIIEIVVALSD